MVFRPGELAQPLEYLLNNEGQSSDLSTDTASQCMPAFPVPRNPKHSSDLCLDTGPCISMCARTEAKAKNQYICPPQKKISLKYSPTSTEKTVTSQSPCGRMLPVNRHHQGHCQHNTAVEIWSKLRALNQVWL